MGSDVATKLPRIGFGAVVAAAVLVPTVFTQQLADPFMLPKATLLWISAIVAALGVAAVAVGRRGAPLPRAQVLAPIALLVAWTAVATVLSDRPMAAIVGGHGRYDGLLTLVAAVVLGLAVVAFTWREPARLEVIAVAIVASGALGFAYVLIEWLGLDWVDWQLQGTSGWLVGLVGNPNFSGAYLAMVVPVVLAMRARATEAWMGPALLAGVGALAVGIWWTGTRGGLVALVAGVAVSGLLLPTLLPRVVRIAAVVATVVLLGGILVSGAFEELPGRQPLGAQAVFQSGGITQRTNIWAGAVAMVQDHPVVGVGPDGFGRALPQYRPSRGGLQMVDADEAHNVFLDRAATTGLPGLAAMLWLLGVVGVAAWRARTRVAEEHRWLLAAFGGSLGAYVVQGLFSIDAIPLLLGAWISIGALVALADPVVLAARQDDVADDPAATPAALAVAGVVVALVLAALALRPVLADRNHRSAQIALEDERPLEALADDQAAATWLDHEVVYQVAQAEDLVAFAGRSDTDPELRRTFFDEALIAYDHALDRSPGDVRLRAAAAQVHVLAAHAAEDPTSADEHLDAAVAIYEELVDDVSAADDLHLPFARVLDTQAQLGAEGGRAAALDAAAEQFELARAYVPARADAAVGLARVRLAQGDEEAARALLTEAIELGGDRASLREAIAELDRQLDGEG